MVGRIIRMIQTGKLDSAITELRAMQERLARRNPPLGLHRTKPKRHYQSQIVGELSREAHAISYLHIEDGRQYKHEFVNRTSLLALFDGERSDVLITSPDGFPIWQDF